MTIWATRQLLRSPKLGATSLQWARRNASQGTLAQQGNLKRLPVPELQDTLATWLVSVKPHLSPKEFTRTQALASSFLTEAEPLQLYLQERAAQRDNWFADWWTDMAYLGYRSPLPVWSSPGFVLPPQQFANNEYKWLAYAAKLISGALDYKTKLDEGTIPVELNGQQPMDMIQYFRLFGATRQPGEVKDQAKVCNNSRFAIVAHRGNFFKLPLLPVYGDKGETISSSLGQIFGALKNIVEQSNRLNRGHAGLLTSDSRDNWFASYTTLKENNSESIDTIEDSLFLLCLDDNLDSHNADVLTKAGYNSLHGIGTTVNATNRWYDKALQFIVAKSGEVSITNEHSFAEAVPTMAIADHIIDYIDQLTTAADDDMRQDIQNVSPPEHIPFILDEPINDRIDIAAKNLDSLVQDLDLKVLDFTDFGKEFIKSQKMSPDSFIQMAIQLTFLKIHKTPAATYESAATRIFKEGRTEVIRSCSEESLEFAKSMLMANTPPASKLNALNNSMQSHNAYARMAVKGQGVDRHLQGLKMAAIETGHKVPELYSDPGYTRSSRMRLSTSQISSKHGSLCCYGPLESDGYGCCYSIGANDLKFAISAMNTDKSTEVREFADGLGESLIDMHDLCLAKAKL